MAAMDLYGSFAGPEFRGNLLVKHPGNHEVHDLALSCRQFAVALLQLVNLSLLFPRGAVTVEGVLNRIQ